MKFLIKDKTKKSFKFINCIKFWDWFLLLLLLSPWRNTVNPIRTNQYYLYEIVIICVFMKYTV